MKRCILLSVLLTATVMTFADEPTGVGGPPATYTWIVTACESWPCAAAALVAAAGSKDVIAVPTSTEKYPWVIVQRVLSGTVWVPPDAPFRIECFDHAADALPHFAALERNAPVMLTVPDGRTLVVALAESPTRSRVVRH